MKGILLLGMFLLSLSTLAQDEVYGVETSTDTVKYWLLDSVK